MIAMRRGRPARALLALLAVAAAHAAPPEIARIQGGNTKLIYGVNLIPGQTEVLGAELPFDEAAALAALTEPPYLGRALLPGEPPADAVKLSVLEADPRGLVMAVAFGADWSGGSFYDARKGPAVCWIRNADGWAKPVLTHPAVPYFAYPSQVLAGSIVRVFGRNLDARSVALRPRLGGKVVTLEGLKGGRNPLYEVSGYVPTGCAPGAYDLYVHNGGGGVAGWGGPITLVVQPPPKEALTSTFVDVRHHGAKGNGIADETNALRQALIVAGRTRDTVVLPPGRFPIRGTLEVPPGVSLVGAGAGNTVIEVQDDSPFQGDFPVRAELEGFARDWLPHLRGQGHAPMVWLRDQSTLSNLTLESGPGVGLGVLVAACPGTARDVRIERCHIRTGQIQRNWVDDAAIFVAGETQRLVVRDCKLEGHGGLDVISTSNRNAYVGRNTITCTPQGSANNVMLRGFDDSLLENNTIRGGDRNFVAQLGSSRGKHEIPEGRKAPAASMSHTVLLGNLLTNSIPRRHNEGETMYEAGGAFWRGQPRTVDQATLTVEGEPFWTDMTGSYVLVLDGRGWGQYRRVVSSTASSLTVSPAWDVLPDTASTLMVNGCFADSLWIDNTEEHTANWTGFWGNSLGHVIDGHILRDGAGLYLWGWSRDDPSPVAFCELIGCFVSGRGQVKLSGQLVFGNSLRMSQVVGARPGPSYHGTPYWLPDYDPKTYAAVDLDAPARALPGLPATAPWKAWNVIEACNLADAAQGIHVGDGVEHLILRHNVVKVDGEALRDETGQVIIR